MFPGVFPTLSLQKSVDDLLKLVAEIVPYNMSHNAEAEACDLAMEVGKLGLLEEFTDSKAYDRVCLYVCFVRLGSFRSSVRVVLLLVSNPGATDEKYIC